MNIFEIAFIVVLIIISELWWFIVRWAQRLWKWWCSW